MSVELNSRDAQALVDPNLREWTAAPGVRTEAAGIRAAFEALSLRAELRTEADGAVRFEAWRTPRASGAVLAAVLAAILYLVLDRLGVAEFPILVAIVLVAYFIPLALLPGYRVSGKVAEGRVSLRVHASGLFARPRRLEAALRFYLAGS